ncbi:MAG: CPBP family intramembrane metalloprotease [Clostridiales bacterium]|nr:CPBP family intramembrane metalloprotease [Clostridiales bacterium]
MFDFHLPSPAPVLLAREKKPGLHWVLEILVFLVVTVLSFVGQFIFGFPALLVLQLSSPEYRAALASGDKDLAAQIMARLLDSDGYVVLSLLANSMMIIVALLFCKLLQKRGAASLGFIRKGMGREYLAGAGAGALAFSAAALLCIVTGSLRLEGISPTFRPVMFALMLMGFLVQGMAEEVLCRGYFMVSLARRYPLWAAVLANSVLFAALHLFNSGITVLAFVNLVLFGVFASLYFVRRGNIWGIGAFHALWNFVQGNVYGVLVSGGGTNCTLLDSTSVPGRELINGGDFGLEGGLAVTAVLAVGCLLMLYRKKENGSEQ